MTASDTSLGGRDTPVVAHALCARVYGPVFALFNREQIVPV